MSEGLGVKMRSTRKLGRGWRVGLVAGWVLLLAANLSAQGIYATLTGVVSDPAQAVVPKAKATLTDSKSGSVRETVTNNDGYFTFASVSVGSFTYELTVEAKGFSTYQGHWHRARRRREAQRQRDAEGRHHDRDRRGHGRGRFDRSGRFRREVGDADHQGTTELRAGRQQRRRVHQDHAGLRHPERHVEQGQLHRRRRSASTATATPAARAR